MMGWADITLAAVTDNTGDLTQLYPTVCTVGTGATTMGTQVRVPREGTLASLQVEPDGINGGEIEIWDINGADAGADVNTAAAITNAQLLALQALGQAKILYSQKFAGGSGARLAVSFGTPFVHGLAGRYINAGAVGTCALNIVADGGFAKVHITG